MKMMRDIDIRESLMVRLNTQNAGHDYRIIPEMGICDGLARVDIAVANGRLCGYEIKSDADTLERLPAQKSYYNKTFDKVTIVVGEKYQELISQHIPDWWGIYVARYNKQGKVVIKEARRARQNKEIEAASLLELLWKEELDQLLRNYGVKGISGKNRRVLRKVAAEKIPFSAIKDYTRETIKTRKEWRSQ